ncbi:GSCOCG00010421001-RA-CDS, partial [Cotesia congregata]
TKKILKRVIVLTLQFRRGYICQRRHQEVEVLSLEGIRRS